MRNGHPFGIVHIVKIEIGAWGFLLNDVDLLGFLGQGRKNQGVGIMLTLFGKEVFQWSDWDANGFDQGVFLG